ncbi:MAG: formimidoylglutamate deiminase [Xanthomonadales bacterium]|nr:formimidoylglutamate deiminase [Xanthomonadales bacterium]
MASWTVVKTFFAPSLLTDQGWCSASVLSVDAEGMISNIAPGASKDCDVSLQGVVIPGMINLHSHAFQRSLVGKTGLRGSGDDSFWSWRQAMYQQVAQLSPEAIEAVSAYCYMELLKGGYTTVAEFHYLHHQKGGVHYANPAETSMRVLTAADAAGIGVTLLPVLYSWAGFGQQPLTEQQLPFRHDLNSYLRLLAQLDQYCENSKLFDWGVAPHSIRAVSESQLQELMVGLAQLNFKGPIHIHIAEQQREVKDCVDYYGASPVRWLLDKLPVNDRWCLIHATHVDSQELKMMRTADVVAGLCPTTEADLGDGIFPASQWQHLGGAWGIGSDSNLCVNATEELRWLEYGQRLQDQQRNLLAAPGQLVGAELYKNALAGGLQALAKPKARGFAVGQRADMLVLDQEHTLFLNKEKDQILDAWIFAGVQDMLSQVWVGGRCVVEAGEHINAGRIETDWRQLLKSK